MEYITILFCLIVTFCQSLLGATLVVLVERFFLKDERQLNAPACTLDGVYCWLLGLLAHLSLALLLLMLGATWWLATVAPLLLAAFAGKQLLLIMQQWAIHVRNTVFRRWDFIAWIVFHLFLGSTLFHVDEAIRTPWMNNYGDLTFHLGMIAHFVTSNDFPPLYHAFAGELLSYPFFVNLWAAMLWWPFDGFSSLSSVFMLQWCLVWAALYWLLSKNKAYVFPFLLLFGGGSYLAIFLHNSEFSWQLIYKGYPWTTWLSTIWVTQRSAMLGALVGVAVGSLLVNAIQQENAKLKAIFAGALLAMTPLVHTHFFMVTALFWGMVMFVPALLEFRQKHLAGEPFSWATLWSTQHAPILVLLVLASLPALLFFPILMGKGSMLGLMAGWNVPLTGGVSGSALMWLKNAFPLFVVFAGIWWLTKLHRLFATMIGLFVLGNIIKLATWEWDQLKFFLAIFVAFMVVWQNQWDAISRDIKWGRLGQYLAAFLLMGPGVYEAGHVLVDRTTAEHRSWEVYNQRKVVLADAIDALVPVEAIVASPTDHNSAATLSGRTLFTGYPGTMSSHSLPYQDRDAINKSLERILNCKRQSKVDVALCPKYLIWDEKAAQYWGGQPNRKRLYSLGKTKFGDEIFEIR